MSDFIEIVGSSGTRYRFRQAALGELPATAGNLIVMTGPRARPIVLFCGAARSLQRAASAAADVLKAHSEARLYIRLNVASTVRQAEHADIVAGVSPAAEASDLG